MAFELDEKFLIDVENQLEAKLPSSYRQAMMIRNGGEISVEGDNWQLHPIFDQSDRKRIARTCNHIIRETKSMIDWLGWPSNALAIAQNGSGDTLLFLRKEKMFSPVVYVWDHESGELHIVAEDFESLI